MTDGSTTQVLGAATTSGAGVALLPATGDSTILQAVTLLAIVAGALVLVSFIATRAYRKFSR